MLDAFTDDWNSGKVRFYSGTRPAGPGTALSGNTLLAEATMGSTAFGAAGTSGTGALATANAITQDSSADASGIPTFARIFKSDGTTVIADVSVGKTGGAEELLINTVDGSGNPFIAAGGPVSISSLTLTFGMGT
jgi:hypothetical protein